MASIAPEIVFAEGGVIIGGGNGPVKGILIEVLVMRKAWLNWSCVCMLCQRKSLGVVLQELSVAPDGRGLIPDQVE